VRRERKLMRNRLIELIQESVDGCAKHWAEIIADHLIENGVVIIDPQKYPPINNQSVIKTVLGVPLDEMAELIDAKQEGRIIVPPCKVGDTVWIVGEHRGVYCANVRVFFFNEKNIEMVWTTKCDLPFSEYGKTFFLSCEEAEKALEKMEGKK
jgi:hypothetical protein